MHRDTISSLLKNNDTIGDLIRKRDDEVDRQYFLIVRLMRSAMMDRKSCFEFKSYEHRSPGL